MFARATAFPTAHYSAHTVWNLGLVCVIRWSRAVYLCPLNAFLRSFSTAEDIQALTKIHMQFKYNNLLFFSSFLGSVARTEVLFRLFYDADADRCDLISLQQCQH